MAQGGPRACTPLRGEYMAGPPIMQSAKASAGPMR